MPANKSCYKSFLLRSGQILATFCLAFALTACGSGSPGGEDTFDSDVDSPLAASEKSARPGDVVLMRVSDELDDTAARSYSWTQVDGPPVHLGDSRRRRAHFQMPPVEINVELTFLVDIHRHDGSTISEMFTIACAGEEDEADPSQPVITEEYVVFRADKDINNRFDLYLSMLDGSAIYRLNGNLVPGGNVNTFKISPDRRYIAYFADQDVSNQHEVYVAAADGSGVQRVSPDLQPGGYVSTWRWSHDSSMLGMIAVTNPGGPQELFTNTLDGSQLTRVSGPLVENGDVYDFNWSPSEALLAYSADQNTKGITELFVSSSDGSENYRVSSFSDVDQSTGSGIHWSPNGTAIAYSIYDNSEGTNGIFAVDSNGDNHRRLSHPRPSIYDFFFSSFDWSPDGSAIAYRSRYYFFDSGSSSITDTYYLFTVAADGIGATQVSSLPLIFGESRTLGDVNWSPDGSRLLYSAEQDTDNQHELYTVGVDGSGNTRVSGVMPADGDVFGGTPNWSPDGSLIAYRANQEADDVVELFVSDPLGAFNQKVSGIMAADGDVISHQWSPDSTYLAYQADQIFDNRNELFTATADGSTRLRVSGSLVFNGGVQGFTWSSDGSRLVYRANQLDVELFELFVAAPDGSVVNANVSGPLTTEGDVFSFATR